MALPPVVALEIGTSKVVALVGEAREDGGIAVVGMGKYSSSGVRKGEVIDIDNAVVCARGALHCAEESAQATVHRVHLVLSGGHIRTQANRGSTRLQNPGAGIADADIDAVMELARAVNLPPERETIHTICGHFCVDDDQYVVNPPSTTDVRVISTGKADPSLRNAISLPSPPMGRATRSCEASASIVRCAAR